MATFVTGTANDFTEVGTETDPTDAEQSDFFDVTDDADSPSDQTNYAEPGQGESFAGQDPSIWSIQGDADDGSTFTSSTPAIETETAPTDGDEPDYEPLEDDNPAVENEDPQQEQELELEIDEEDSLDDEETDDDLNTDQLPVEEQKSDTVEIPELTEEPDVYESDDELEEDDQLILDENTAGPDFEDSPQDIAELAYTGTQEEQEPELDVESDDELSTLALYTELEMLDQENDLLSIGEIQFEYTNLVEFVDLDLGLFDDEDADGFTNFVDETDEGL